MCDSTHSLPDVGEGEFVIEFYDSGGPDELSRRRFFAYWLADNAGPACDEHGVRGQVFFTDPAEFARDAHQRGYAVRYLNNEQG
jgi:hypothetical protein